jgi:hypothetical protein
LSGLRSQGWHVFHFWKLLPFFAVEQMAVDASDASGHSGHDFPAFAFA